ncbi:ORF03L [Marbled eel polyomavirus]|uniref:ORF03L n=1 Tax=Marbled eel polyomavirus TaxID=1662286 RepID=UPI0007C175AD|nr:ORF03L [Marbled eel polyomavirus]ANC70194.1 ORF03L [Marbled eel polyomavirus]
MVNLMMLSEVEVNVWSLCHESFAQVVSGLFVSPVLGPIISLVPFVCKLVGHFLNCDTCVRRSGFRHTEHVLRLCTVLFPDLSYPYLLLTEGQCVNPVCIQNILA